MLIDLLRLCRFIHDSTARHNLVTIGPSILRYLKSNRTVFFLNVHHIITSFWVYLNLCKGLESFKIKVKLFFYSFFMSNFFSECFLITQRPWYSKPDQGS
jgi:hypothetical protein